MSSATGLHHITAVGGNPQQNLDFYRRVLGLQLVKKTVNFDDPSTYHLFYGDRAGRPGSIISFFCDPMFEQGEPDTGQGVAVAFAISPSSVDFWVDYLVDKDIDFVEPFERFGNLVIGLRDPDGLHLELVSNPDVEMMDGREQNEIPARHAIRGLHGITLAEENHRATAQLLQESLGFEEIDDQLGRHLFLAHTEPGGIIELLSDVALAGTPGKGTVHHMAFRAENEQHQQKMRKDLTDVGYHLTQIEDRHYFKSFFFHEPGGGLVEVATNGPGFTVDEELDELGSKLCLPPDLEKKRSLIEAELPKIEH